MSGAARVFSKGDRVIFRPGQAEVYGEAPGKVYTVLRTYPHKRYKRTWVDLDDRGQPGGTVDSKELRPAPREPFIGTATVRNPSKRAERFIGRTIKKLAKKGERGKQAVAIAYTKARRAGFRIPKEARRNPRYSESSIWEAVLLNAQEIRQDAKPRTWNRMRADRIIAWAKEMLAQLARGVHENPAIAVLGNPGDSAAGTLSDRVYEVRYRHSQDGRDYKHQFGPGVRATLLKDGRVVLWHPSKRIWKDFA